MKYQNSVIYLIGINDTRLPLVGRTFILGFLINCKLTSKLNIIYINYEFTIYFLYDHYS